MSSLFDLNAVQNTMLEALDSEKEKEVLFYRFGLNNRKVYTLEYIGKRFGVTRERIRQIEKTVLKKIKNFKAMKNSFNFIHKVVSNSGGVISSKDLYDSLKIYDDNSKIVLNILLVASPEVVSINNKYFSNSWRINVLEEDKLNSIAKSIVSFFKDTKRVASFKDILKERPEFSDINQALLKSVINSCALIGKDTDGKFGLNTWGIIKPKNTRDRSYVALKTIGKPLHYRKLTELICSENRTNKKVSVEAVHNELIRDNRFVLVGRGIYALKEWGYSPGTVADVIEEILKEHSEPMHKNDIIKKVLERRFVRKNTILLSLQEKPQFERVVRAVYKLRG
ncbi:hypothetical protein HGB13_02300 [bacterium]|nr:hypothetical protein [bacterium]